MSGGAQRRKRESQYDYVERTSSRASTPSIRKHYRDSKSSSYRESDGAAQPEDFSSRLFPAVSFYILILASIIALTGLFWSLNQPSAPILQPASGSTHSSVYDRGLVTTRVSSHSVLLEHGQYWSNVSHRHFQSSVLAYVTPWNGKGYDMAKLFRAKFTHVSPVWYQLKGTTKDSLSLHGRHDVDQQWIKDVRKEGSPLIVPRVVLEGWALDMLIMREERKKAVQLIVNEIIENEFDGIVLEAWSLWRSYRILEDAQLRKKTLEFVKILGSELHSLKGTHLYSSGPPQLVFVIPPPGNPRDPATFTARDMTFLNDAVDGFSLMTYDYSSPQSPGPNAPLAWVQQCLHLLFPKGSKEAPAKSDLREKMLMGINFYGNDYIIPQGGGPIMGSQYISILAQNGPQISWDEASQEHYLEYVKEESKPQKKRVYYPSLKSLAVRLREAETWGVGISIWEVGQGLDYFFDLL